MGKGSLRAKLFTFSSGFLGLIVLGLVAKELKSKISSQSASLQTREKRRAESKLLFTDNTDDKEGSTEWVDDYYEGSGTEGDGLWVHLIEQLNEESPVSLKKTGKTSETKRAKKVLREKTRDSRKFARADQKARNVVTGPNYLSLSKKSLARAEFKLKNMWVQQAEEWVKTNERSWEFGSFQDQSFVDNHGKLPDQFSGYPGHGDVAPAVNTLLEAGQCESWQGGERPLNLFFAVQNSVPLHASNKRTDFSHVMQFVGDIIKQVDSKSSKIKVFEYNEKDIIEDPVFSLSYTTIRKRKNFNRQMKQLQKSTKSRPTISRSQIKPMIEKLNNVMTADKNTLMSGSTNVVILFITNIPGDLYSVDEEYLKNEIDELNKKAFVIVVFVHPQSHDELRTIPYRIIPKSWTHGLRDNEFAQRILVQKFNELASANNKDLVNSVRSMLCLVDERLQCRLSNRPWADGKQSMTMRSTPMIDSCCGHEIAAHAYDSRFKTCCRDGTVKSWLADGTNPCGDSNKL